MALTITITNPRTIARIQREAARRGLSPSETVEAAFMDQGDASVRIIHDPSEDLLVETPVERAERHAAIQRTLAIMHAAVTDADRAFDDDAWLYDEQGLPH